MYTEKKMVCRLSVGIILIYQKIWYIVHQLATWHSISTMNNVLVQYFLLLSRGSVTKSRTDWDYKIHRNKVTTRHITDFSKSVFKRNFRSIYSSSRDEYQAKLPSNWTFCVCKMRTRSCGDIWTNIRNAHRKLVFWFDYVFVRCSLVWFGFLRFLSWIFWSYGTYWPFAEAANRFSSVES